MGAGIAKSIKQAYPEAYIADLTTIKGDKKKLGTYTQAIATLKDSSQLTIINAYTQYDFRGYKNTVNVDYKALGKCFRNLKNEFGNKQLRFGFPLIGAGLAGGDWSLIKSIIEAELYDEDIELVIFKK